MRKDWEKMLYKDAVVKISTSKQKLRQKEYLQLGEFPVVDQGEKLIGGYSNDLKRILKCKLPVVVFGDHTKCVKLVNFKFIPGADGTKVLEPRSNFNPRFIAYLTQVLVYKINDKGYARHYQYIEKKNLPVVPLVEQRAIVAKIEELFSNLDKGIADLKKAQDQLKVYRHAVLKKAFEGLDEIPFDQLVTFSQNGMAKRRGSEGSETKVLRLADITNLEIDNSSPRSIILTQKELEKYQLHEGDLLAIRVNGSIDLVGRFIHVTKKDELENWGFCDHLIRIILEEEIAVSKFYLYFFQLPKVRKFIHENMVSSAGQNTVSQGPIKAISVPITSLENQFELVREIESRLSVCDKVEQTLIESLEKANALRQSILKKPLKALCFQEKK